MFPAVLCAALPVAIWLVMRFLFPLPEALSASGLPAASEFAAVVQPHLLRALDLGLLLISIHLLAHREDGAVPALFAVAASMLMGFVPALHAPDVWMQALPLAVLAGVGTAKTGRN
ncbi:hypothetical protein SDC9_185588 [bioreactor metagenome]|uniref:Uncharacterized protein n=1 Tax=bioreactor metagenome TaxID=1076179 RepID=A0A645HG95_9ZZZZ